MPAMTAYSGMPSLRGCSSKVPMQPRREGSSPPGDRVFHVTKSGADPWAWDAERELVEVAGVNGVAPPAGVLFAAGDAVEELEEVDEGVAAPLSARRRSTGSLRLLVKDIVVGKDELVARKLL